LFIVCGKRGISLLASQHRRLQMSGVASRSVTNERKPDAIFSHFNVVTRNVSLPFRPLRVLSSLPPASVSPRLLITHACAAGGWTKKVARQQAGGRPSTTDGERLTRWPRPTPTQRPDGVHVELHAKQRLELPRRAGQPGAKIDFYRASSYASALLAVVILSVRFSVSHKTNNALRIF